MTLTISAGSKQYVGVIVRTVVAGVETSPIGHAVEMAFTAPGDNASSATWYSASWETNTTTTPATFTALCLVGLGVTPQLAVGTYWVWVRITDSPELPVVFGGTLVVI